MKTMSSDIDLPIINISALISGFSEKRIVAQEIGEACREYGFFYITGHGIDETLQNRLEDLSRYFFKKPLEEKLKIKMAYGGRAWRGFFSVGGELTSGKPDLKEGLYFGQELEQDHPLVKSNTPLHGRNLFPETPNLRQTVLDYMTAMTELGHKIMEGIAMSLDLNENYFYDRYTKDPLILFRIFNYPKTTVENSWGVGEHTDYGLLTILKQDFSGGLQVKCKSSWIEAPPVYGSLVCNIGDMLDRMTGGVYRSTPHRVKSPLLNDRLSFPFFFDPSFNSKVNRIESLVSKNGVHDDKETRWDKESVHQFSGTYGDYFLNKAGKVFPQLTSEVL